MTSLESVLCENFEFDNGKIVATKPNFSGIGPLRTTDKIIKREYERLKEHMLENECLDFDEYLNARNTVLSYFFTNTDSNIYCATDNMPSQLWPMLLGQYARDSLPLREKLIKLFNNLGIKNNSNFLIELAKKINENKDISEKMFDVLSRASEFIEEFGVVYGHASLRDSGIIGIATEGVSQIITKYLESERVAAYQEQSTRATPFIKKWLAVPFELKGTEFEKKINDFQDRLIDFYKESNSKLKEYFYNTFFNIRQSANEKISNELKNLKINCNTDNYFITDSQWNSIIKSKAFDVARSLLPLNMTTNLGTTINTRVLQQKLSEWLSSDNIELRVVAHAIKNEAIKLFPNLIKHSNESDYYSNSPKRSKQILENLVSEDKITMHNLPYTNSEISSKLISYTPNIEDHVLASILFNQSPPGKSFESLLKEIPNLNKDDKIKLFRSILEDKKKYEQLVKYLEIGSFVFERNYDIGAYRDLQRHRGDRQQRSKFSAASYVMPPEFKDVGLDKEFIKIMNESKQLYDEIENSEYSSTASYFCLMAHTVRHVITEDPFQALYVANLRTKSSGIDSYRNIAQQEIEQIFMLMPHLKKAYDELGMQAYDPVKKYNLPRLDENINANINKAVGDCE